MADKERWVSHDWLGRIQGENVERRNDMVKAKDVSRGQALEVSARVATQVNWGELDEKKLQEEIINLSPVEFGQRFTAFLKNGGRVSVTEATKRLQHLNHIATITLPKSSGRTIAEAKDVFNWIDPDFERWGLNKKGKPAKQTDLDLLEMSDENGTFKDMFGWENTAGWIGKMSSEFCLSQDQIVDFCEKHRNQLRKDGYGTFFLFKEKIAGEWKFFVAYVYFLPDGSLNVDVHRLSYARRWDAESCHRLVVPATVA